MKSILLFVWQRFRWPLILLLVYLLVEQLFVSLAIDDGVFFPSVSGRGLFVAGLGLAVVGLRLLVWGLLPVVIGYKLSMKVFGKPRPR